MLVQKGCWAAVKGLRLAGGLYTLDSCPAGFTFAFLKNKLLWEACNQINANSLAGKSKGTAYRIARKLAGLSIS